MNAETVREIFNINNLNTFNVALNAVFQFQLANNSTYKEWCNLLKPNYFETQQTTQIPFLPISFFKTHAVQVGEFSPSHCFESSGTTTSINSKHLIKNIAIYEQSFNTAFEKVYGSVNDYCIIGLLPSYLERNNSSLVYMVNDWIEKSRFTESGFYLNEFNQLAEVLQTLESKQQKTLLIGVTFGLLDFAEQFSFPLQQTIVMETGGMKGRRTEMTRNEVHEILKNAFQTDNIHSEYGMTELLSQAYSTGNGRFVCPPWMKVLVRSEDDPLQIATHGKGVLNIIDLANIYSCSFIATDDVGIVYEDGSFEVHGRMDNSDIRGCSLMAMNDVQ
jgi:hypothetical protein